MDLIKVKNNIKDTINAFRKNKKKDYDSKTLNDIKKIETNAIEELKTFLTDWSLKYPEIIRVNMASGMGSYFSFRTDEVDKIAISIKFGLGIESI